MKMEINIINKNSEKQGSYAKIRGDKSVIFAGNISNSFPFECT